jgi:hypothetical protein
MAEMEKKNLKSKVSFLARVSISTFSKGHFTSYGTFEDEWNKQADKFNELYTAVSKTHQQLLGKMLDKVKEQEKISYSCAVTELQQWDLILPDLFNTYVKYYNDLTSRIKELKTTLDGESLKKRCNSERDKTHNNLQNALTKDGFTTATESLKKLIDGIDEKIKEQDELTKCEEIRSEIKEIHEMIESQHGKTLKSLPHLRKNLDTLIQSIDESETSGDLEEKKASLEKLPNLLKSAATYIEKHDAAIKAFEELKSIPEVKDAKSNHELQKMISDAESLMEKEQFDNAIARLNTVDSDIIAARSKRIIALKQQLNVPEAQEGFFGQLMDTVGGPGLVDELAKQFPKPAFAEMLDGFNPPDKRESSKATNQLVPLVKKLKGAGVKSLCVAFSGSGSFSKEGAKAIQKLLDRGVDETQLSELNEKFKEGLKVLIDDGFSGDSALFSEVLMTGLTTEKSNQKGKQKSGVSRLKEMADEFDDKADLGKLINGLVSPPGDELQDKKDAGERIKRLLSMHFDGNSKKLKDPFFDKLKDSEELMRQATTFDCKPVSGEKTARVGGYIVNIGHFLNRHTREHFNVKEIKDSNTQFPTGTTEEKIKELLAVALEDEQVKGWLAERSTPVSFREKSLNLPGFGRVKIGVEIGRTSAKVSQFFPRHGEQFSGGNLEKIARGLGKVPERKN